MGLTSNTANRRTAPSTVAAGPVRRRPWWRSHSLRGIGYATPTAVIVVGLFVVPLGLLLWMSLNDWPLLRAPTFNFPGNYTAIRDHRLFIDAVWFTLRYTAIVTVLLSVVAFGMAMLVQERRRGVGIFRAAFFLPGAIGLAATSLLFYGLLSNQAGPVDDLLRGIGVVDGPIAWRGTPNMALFSTIVLVVWRFAGFNMLILLTGLQSIPTDVYEAAKVDGANRWRVFRHVTLPLLRPTIALMLILSITGSLLAFEQFFIFTRGGPDNSTVSTVMVVYRAAFVRFDLGSAAAISAILLLALVLLNTLQLRVLRRRND